MSSRLGRVVVTSSSGTRVLPGLIVLTATRGTVLTPVGEALAFVVFRLLLVVARRGRSGRRLLLLLGGHAFGGPVDRGLKGL